MAEFSVLIPVFNVAPYLERCVTSVLNQTFPDFELILIDDGSTDDSWLIMKRFAERDPRIRIRQNEVNSGTFVSRSRLIRESKGKYLTFVDADDEIAPTFLQEAKNILDREHFDIVEFGFRIPATRRFKPVNQLKPARWKLRGAAVFHDYFMHPSFSPTVWARVYDGELLRSQRFPEIRLTNYEDYVFVTLLLCRAESYFFSGKPLYLYHCGVGCCCRTHYSLENFKIIGRSTYDAFAFMDSFWETHPLEPELSAKYENDKLGAYHALLEIILSGKIDATDQENAFDALMKIYGSGTLLKLLQKSALLNEYAQVAPALKTVSRFGGQIADRWRQRILGIFR